MVLCIKGILPVLNQLENIKVYFISHEIQQLRV